MSAAAGAVWPFSDIAATAIAVAVNGAGCALLVKPESGQGVAL
jgi:hypothetical protein